MAMAGGRLDWETIRCEAEALAQHEAVLRSILGAMVLDHPTFEEALVAILAHRLAGTYLTERELRRLFSEIVASNDRIGDVALRDLRAILARDPACRGRVVQPMLFFKGYHALQSYRIAHRLEQQGRCDLALLIQARVSEAFGVDIHPAARLGAGIVLDHATGIVIGETAVVGDDVTLLHGVTLGSTGKEHGDRHPKVAAGVLIGAGASVLGHIRIGRGAKVGAGSVVTCDVPPYCTAVGVPARIIRRDVRPIADPAIATSLQPDLQAAEGMR